MSIAEPPSFPLELASGRNEITAPYQESASRTSQRKRPEPLRAVEPAELAPASGAPQIAETQPVVEAAAVLPTIASTRAPLIDRVAAANRREIPRPPWLLFAAALIVVAAATWWVMQQRMPEIDPQQVIARNLSAARQAMADGRYVDPPERSALHHYSTVLALNPASDEAREGIDAIAERYLSDARTLLNAGRVAEAGVALDRARRARPDHRNLVALDARMRAELNKLLADASAVSEIPPQRTQQQTATSPPASQPAVKDNVVNRSLPDRVAKTSAPAAAERPASNVTQESRSEADAASRSREQQARVIGAADRTVASAPAAVAGKVAAPPPSLTIDESAPAIEGTVTPPAMASTTPPSAPATSGSAPIVAPSSAPLDAAPPKLIKLVKPEYPQDARMRGVEGWVDISLGVTAGGDVVDPRIEESNRGRMFNRAALSAVQQWKYAPRPADAQSDERLRVRLEFRLSD